MLLNVFLTQELNQGPLHCSWILYQMSHLGIPLNVYGNIIYIYIHTHIYIYEILCYFNNYMFKKE